MTIYKACLQRLGHLELQHSSNSETSIIATLLQVLNEHDPSNTITPFTNPFARTISKLRSYQTAGIGLRKIEELFGANVNVTNPAGD